MPQPAAYHGVFDFKVGRRIPWGEELDALERHLDTVCARLDSAPGIEQYRLGGDLSSAALHFEVVLVAESEEQADTKARSILGEAIRGAGGAHEGLLNLRAESRAKSNVNAWSGLRTPHWQLRSAKVTRGAS
ncbi:MAG TPA: hypothetical protein VGC47_05760 [Acidimicrobiia bacterium]|jgi:hypothetical protein